MNKKEVFGQAMGLKRTAENQIKAGQGSQAVPTIVRSAAKIIVREACSVNGHNPFIHDLVVTRAMTWTEVLTIANTICEFASQTKQE